MNISVQQAKPIQVYQQQTEKNTETKQALPSTTLNASTQVEQNTRSQGDSISLSQDAKLLSEANRVALDANQDVRADKVALLREQVKNGTYQADSANIAKGLLREERGFFGIV